MTNFHATLRGANFKTKKALKQAVDNGEPVKFEDTSMFNSRGTVSAADLRPADCIVGPDPHRQRNWYANVKNGKVV